MLLLLTAVFIPYLVLAALSLRMIGQERQLEARRTVEERQRRLTLVGQQLLSLLENFKLRQLAQLPPRSQGTTPGPPVDRSIAFVGPVRESRVRLPWDDDPGARLFRGLVNEARFASQLGQAGAEERAAHYEKAEAIYSRAIEAARHPAQQAYARLLLAQGLEKAGRKPEERRRQYERVLELPLQHVDEYGVPLAFYAAPHLLGDDLRRQGILRAIRMAAEREGWLSPAALYQGRDLARLLKVSELESRFTEQISDREQAEALQADFARLVSVRPAREPLWIAFGQPVWMVSVAAGSGGADAWVLAVRADQALRALDSTIRLAGQGEGSSLGESLPGLSVVIPATVPPPANYRQTLLVSALTLTLTLTLLAAFLLWRDVRRDMELAEMRSQFVSSVSHELKTPLTTVRMFSETMRLDEEMDRQTQCEYLDTILSESERLGRLVDNVLDFARIEQGVRIYHLQPARLEDVVEEAARVIRFPLTQSGFTLDLAVERTLPPIEADRDALLQAILNLMTNAMKYSGTSRRIGIDLRREGDDALIAVTDYGDGIAPEEHVRIFERFYRAPTSQGQYIPGAGLGLTLVAHVAKAHGGDVAVRSSPGAGSTFTIRLPIGAE
jgi:signal transduction histidine kinase